MIENGHPMLWFPEERVGSWMKAIIPNAELRSSAELLTELQKAEGRESCLGHSKKSIQETGAAHVSSQTSIKETCADTLSVSPSQAAFFTQRTILTTERKWKVIPANSSSGEALPPAVSKMVTRMVRHYDQDERQSDAALDWDTITPVLLKAFAKTWSTRFLREALASTFSWRKQQDKIRVLRGFQKFFGFLPSNSRTLWWNINWTWVGWGTFGFFRTGKCFFFFAQCCSFSIWSVLENGLIPGGKESDKGRQTIFFTPLSPFGGDSDEEEPRDDHTVPQKVHYHGHWKRNQDAVYWIKLSRAQSYAIIVHSPVAE